MSIIAGIRDWLAACPLLSDIKADKRHIDWTDADANNYGVITDGDTLIKKYVNGQEIRQYTFALNIRKLAATDINRLSNAEFIENMQIWCNTALLPAIKDVYITSVECVNGLLLSMDKSGKTGEYQIQFKMIYRRTNK